jgi:aspartyl-tRNA(Asn)/glutamyl-tRNA(Gln) amidotransferase subunit C
MEIVMAISREDVLRVAELAHLGLTPEEVEDHRNQLDAILNYVGKLNELDITNVTPMAQVIYAPTTSDTKQSHPELREDVPRPCTVAEAVLMGAPDAAKPFFRVPKVIER